MTASFSMHPIEGRYKARFQQRNQTIWVKLTQGAGDNLSVAVFFFDSLSHARAVTEAFNSGPQPEAMDETDSFTFKPVDNGVPDEPEN